MNSPQNYGFIYNEFVIDTSRNIIVKRLRETTPENKDGKMKLQKEIGFYNSLTAHKIPEPFVFPRIYSTTTTTTATATATGDSHRGALPELHIQYFPDHEPLTERFPYAPASQALIIKVIREILDCISPLHANSPRLQITDKEYNDAIRAECYDKIVERYHSVKWEEDIYPDIRRLNYVNGVKVRPFLEYANIIKDRVGAAAVAGACGDRRYLTFIHGDTHLGNILVPKRNDDDDDDDDDLPKYVFIDPRGYFASYDVYGDKHYDYAKLLFGISGYSRFDQMMIHNCDIVPAGDADADNADALCIQIPFIDETARIYESLTTPEWQSAVPEITSELTRIISLSIWLGNNSTFVSPHKKLMSLMIGRYLCERFLG
jgi:hypothetical protein